MEALLASTLVLTCPSQLIQSSAKKDYHDNCRVQCEVQAVRSPIVLGGEGQSLGAKDTLSVGPLDTH